MATITSFARSQLVSTARDMLDHLDQGHIDLAEDIMQIDSSVYSDPARFRAEKDKVFRRLPLMLAASCELGSYGDYKALEVGDVPVLLTRGKDGEARAFLNSCTHRGTSLVCGSGHSTRFTCPYHGWTFANEGRLIGIASQQYYGDVDKTRKGLVEFPVFESAGLIWAILDPESELDIKGFLAGIDDLVAGFDLSAWQLFHQCSLKGANWKLAFDAHMDFYHLPVLHKNTFGRQISNMAQYYFQGAHQRLGLMSNNPVEQEDLGILSELPESEWPIDPMLFGEWIIFPNTSLNCFKAGVRIMVISQIFPGATPEDSITVQTFLVENQPSKEDEDKVLDFVKFINQVVGEEDLPMSVQQQRALSSGLLKEVEFGRNEVGLQQYHHWLEQVLAEDDSSLNALFNKR